MARKGFLYSEISPERGCAETVMAKNFVEEGKRWRLLPVQPSAAEIWCRWVMFCGGADRYSIQGETGDGITEGVFMLPKLKTDDMKTGKKVYLKSGKVQLTNSGSDPRWSGCLGRCRNQCRRSIG